jgi:DUF4097 and DUF4098 domain-containing protein YvlB
MSTVRALFAVTTLAAAAAVGAQQPAAGACDDQGFWRGWRTSGHACEVRDITVPSRETLAVDAANGGINVTGADRGDVSIRATVHAWAEDEAAARAVLGEIVLETNDVIRASGPAQRGRVGWSVSYDIAAPRETDLDLDTVNGSIAITNLRGDLEFDATNGAVKLEGVAGNVRGATVNGGVEVTLTGARWDGDALDVRTTNGGVRLRVPEGYSARLETHTVNGGTNIDFPVTVQGRLGRNVSTTLGDGGALVSRY